MSRDIKWEQLASFIVSAPSRFLQTGCENGVGRGQLPSDALTSVISMRSIMSRARPPSCSEMNMCVSESLTHLYSECSLRVLCAKARAPDETV